MQRRSMCKTRIVAILACFCGCAGTGEAWRRHGRIKTAERRKPEFVESKTWASSRSPALEVEAEERREGDAPAPRSRLVSSSVNDGRKLNVIRARNLFLALSLALVSSATGSPL